MTDIPFPLPSLDTMLSSLLLVEEGQHEFPGQEEGVQDIRQLFFPVTRTSTYLNHAALGPLPGPVVTSVKQYLEDTSAFGGIHEPSWVEYERGAHRRLACMINARPDQVAFTASTSDGLMMVAQGLRWQKGDVIISAEGEFPSNVYPWLNLEELGVQIHTVAMRDNRILTNDVLESISERTRLVSIGLVEFSTGYRNDIATIAKYCHQRGIFCGIDAMQALGALDINVQELDVDFMAAASHKWLLSPRMCGILYISDDLLPQLRTPRRGWFSVEVPFDFFNHSQPLKAGAARFEHSTSIQTTIIGLDAALGIFESIDGGMQAVEKRILGLTKHAIAGLERLGYPVVSSQEKGERSGIVCFKPHPQREDLTTQHIISELASRNIYTAARTGIVRISPHFYNTLEEIDKLLNVLEELQQPARMVL